jgi:hypothetical protein
MLTKRLLSNIILLAFAGNAFANDRDRDDHDRKWVASWATSPATFFQYVPPVAPVPPGPPVTFAPANIQPDLIFPFPNANTAGATDQTIRSIVKPDLWGNQVRIRFSSVFGNQPVTFDSVTVGLQEYSANVVDGTMTRVTFGGRRSVTIPAGQEMWSDGVRLSWVDGPDDPGVQGRNLSISFQSRAERPDDLPQRRQHDVVHQRRGATTTPAISTSSRSSSRPPPGSSWTPSTSWPMAIPS